MELRHFDGQTRFVSFRPAGEDVENQLGSIEDFNIESLLEIADLGRREIVVEQHHVGVLRGGQLLQFGELSLAHVGCDVGRLASLRQLPDHVGAGRFGQPC